MRRKKQDRKWVKRIEDGEKTTEVNRKAGIRERRAKGEGCKSRDRRLRRKKGSCVKKCNIPPSGGKTTYKRGEVRKKDRKRGRKVYGKIIDKESFYKKLASIT